MAPSSVRSQTYQHTIMAFGGWRFLSHETPPRLMTALHPPSPPRNEGEQRPPREPDRDREDAMPALLHTGVARVSQGELSFLMCRVQVLVSVICIPNGEPCAIPC